MKTAGNNSLLLDTNIVVALFNKDKAVMAQIEKGADIFIPAIVLGELYFGAEKSSQKTANFKNIEQLVKVTTILDCDANTAKHYGKIKNELKLKGTPIPENDIWIAAIASQHDIALITRDKHFDHISSIDTIEW